ncbi:GGDEF domain-containing protein [Candidatus Bipolaricaulota bacterium]
MRRERKILRAHWSFFGGFSLAVVYWFVEAILHLSIVHGRDFRSALLPLDDVGELWTRVLTAVLFVVFGVVMDVVLTRLHRVHQERGRLVEQLESRTHDLAERAKELGCLYAIDELARREGATIGEILEGTARLIPSSWQYPEIAEGRITYEGEEFAAKTSKRTEWRQTSDIVIDRTPVGSIEVSYSKAMPEKDEGPFMEEERKLLDSIAGRLAGIIKQKRAELALRESEARLQQLSRTDGLTGLLDRRGWNESLAEEERRAQRHGHLSCVMIADLDGLKETNDRQGHAAGDELIRRTADCIRGAVRDVDKVARIGGDEFAILAIECDEDTADTMAKRIEEAWAAEGIRASWGVAMRNPTSGLNGAMAEADRLMYEMKADRRTSYST